MLGPIGLETQYVKAKLLVFFKPLRSYMKVFVKIFCVRRHTWNQRAVIVDSRSIQKVWVVLCLFFDMHPAVDILWTLDIFDDIIWNLACWTTMINKDWLHMALFGIIFRGWVFIQDNHKPLCLLGSPLGFAARTGPTLKSDRSDSTAHCYLVSNSDAKNFFVASVCYNTDRRKMAVYSVWNWRNVFSTFCAMELLWQHSCCFDIEL